MNKESRTATGVIDEFFGPDALDLTVGTLDEQGRIDRVTHGSEPVLERPRSELVGVELAALVHPEDVDLLSTTIQRTTERREATYVVLRVCHTTREWAETRCLFCPSSDDGNAAVIFLLAQPIRHMHPGHDADRIATLEHHLHQFASELHSGGWPGSVPREIEPGRLARLDELPPRQREVVDRLLAGERIPTIAEAMYISRSTTRNHLSYVFTVFGVHSQSELLALLRPPSA